MAKKRNRNTPAQKAAYERYVNKTKDDISYLSVRLSKKQKEKCMEDAYNAGMSLTQYVKTKLGLLEEA